MDAMTEFVREGLKTKLDRRWVSCGNPSMCPAMASVVPRRIRDHAQVDSVGTLNGYRRWLAEQLQRFTGPPNMELRVLDDDEIESRADYMAVLMRIPLPDSNGSGGWFPVGRLGYTEAPVTQDVSGLMHDVHELLNALVLHESKEWLRHDEKHVVDPHPELN